MLVLQNGWILLSYNERATDGKHPFTIKVSFSGDNGKSWTGGSLVYQAGITSGTGCWEPAQVQLPGGEIQLFFSNEGPYRATDEQEITLLRSFDNGATWSRPERVSFRPGHRDGMPVPVALNDSSSVVFAIEDNGLAGTFKPAVAAAGTGLRWPALEAPLAGSVYAGAPYLRQFPSGETVLSVQSGEGRIRPGTLDFSRMVVYVGDSTARNFTSASEPFSVPPGANGLWNALFIKNAVTVTAISGTTIGGVAGVWAMDGRLQYPDSADHPEVEAVVNAAGGGPGPVAPGEVVSLSGSGLPPQSAGADAPGITVFFGGIASPAAYVSPGSIEAVVPYEVSDSADAVVEYQGGRTHPYPLGVVPAAPEIFTRQDGSTQMLAINQDGSANSPENPVATGSHLTFWATGQGQVYPADAGPMPVLPLTASIGGLEAPVIPRA